MAGIETHPVGPREARQPPAAAASTPGTASAESFGGALATEQVRWSRHAQERLASRRLHLSPDDLARIAQGVDRAAKTGARDSLVLLDQLALIVNVRNRTVLTALDGRRLEKGVVTNIDSTVFA